VLAVIGAIRVRTTRAKDGPSTGQNAADIGNIEPYGVSVERTTPTVTETHKMVSMNLNALAHYGANHGVQTWAVSAPCEHADPHVS
jgi:hypothetical protein